MAKDKQAKKGLPKRTGKRAAYKAKCWEQQKRRKDRRRHAQQQAHKRNVERGYSAWDEAKAKRYAKRHP